MIESKEEHILVLRLLFYVSFFNIGDVATEYEDRTSERVKRLKRTENRPETKSHTDQTRKDMQE